MTNEIKTEIEDIKARLKFVEGHVDFHTKFDHEGKIEKIHHEIDDIVHVLKKLDARLEKLDGQTELKK